MRHRTNGFFGEGKSVNKCGIVTGIARARDIGGVGGKNGGNIFFDLGRSGDECGVFLTGACAREQPRRTLRSHAETVHVSGNIVA